MRELLENLLALEVGGLRRIRLERQRRVQLRPGALLPFEVEVPASLAEAKSSYSLRVHIDMSGSGEVEVGDLVSTQSYPVLTRGHGGEAKVSVRAV